MSLTATAPHTRAAPRGTRAARIKRLTDRQFISSIGAYYGHSVEELQSADRSKPLSTRRQIAMYLMRTLTERSYQTIARTFGGRDHTTVIYACRTIAARLDRDRTLAREIAELSALLGAIQ